MSVHCAACGLDFAIVPKSEQQGVLMIVPGEICGPGYECPRCRHDHLRRWVADLMSGMYVNCVYCGHRYGPRESALTSMADVLKRHIERCPEHPLSHAWAEIERLTAELNAVRVKMQHSLNAGGS